MAEYCHYGLCIQYKGKGIGTVHVLTLSFSIVKVNHTTMEMLALIYSFIAL